MKKKPWTTKEREVLRRYYKKIPMEDLLAKLPDRNPNSIYKQVLYLRKRGWSI